MSAINTACAELFAANGMTQPLTTALGKPSCGAVSPDSKPFLPLAAPWFGEEERQELLRVLDSDWITTGPRTQAFEQAFAEYVGCRHAVAVNSCTAAMHLVLAALDIGPAEAVITTVFTFCATAHVIDHCRATPVFVDIRPDTYNIDPAQLRKLLETGCDWHAGRKQLTLKGSGKRVRAILAVHYGGHPCDMDEINALAAQYGLHVIEDAAHAVGAEYRGQKIGRLGLAACFSFYATKNLCTGEGGMLTTDDGALAERARNLCLHGMSRDAWGRYGRGGSWRYDVLEAGFKYNLSDLASALGIHQLRKLDMFNRRRAELAAFYREQLAGLPLALPMELPETRSAWHLYPVRVLSDTMSREQVIEGLRARNIGSSVHFIPLHLMTFYRDTFGCREGDFPVAESVFRRILSLPLFARMSNADVERVADALREILKG